MSPTLGRTIPTPIAAEAVHPASRGGVDATPWGTRELSALDLDGNCLTFFGRDAP